MLLQLVYKVIHAIKPDSSICSVKDRKKLYRQKLNAITMSIFLLTHFFHKCNATCIISFCLQRNRC